MTRARSAPPANESLAVTHHSHTRLFAVRHGPAGGTVTPLQHAGAGRSATSLTRLPCCRYAAWPFCAAHVSCVCDREGDRVSRLRDSGDHDPERAAFPILCADRAGRQLVPVPGLSDTVFAPATPPSYSRAHVIFYSSTALFAPARRLSAAPPLADILSP